MSTGIWSAASGAVGQTSALDLAAQNIANASTPGFRAEEAVFRQTLVNAVKRGSPGSLATSSMRYAITRTTAPDFHAGQITSTGRPLDVAIPDDKSFFMVQTPAGERYTRAGSFRIAVDGTLTTPDGHPVLGESHRPVQVAPTSHNVSIDRDGNLVADGVPGARVARVTFQNPSRLERDGQVLFRANPGAGRPVKSDVTLEQAALEQSNANPVNGMTTLVNASRQFEMITKVIEAFSDIDKRAATEIMKR